MLRFLTILTFLILTAPMWDMCSDSSCKKMVAQPVDVQLSTEENKSPAETVKPITRKIIGKTFLNGYELVEVAAISIYKLEFPKDPVDFGLCLFIPFFLISIVLLFLAFWEEKRKLFFRWSAINFCLLLISYFLILSDSDFNQMKYGFYLLMLNSFLILIFGKISRF
ncbi:MAG: hypothetical protein LBT29_03330 [Flavobacteriaceae bacterium]|nr:hypothetical protein [Flavobacteriaceae bacterium]